MGRYLLRRLNLFIATSLVLIAILFFATRLFPAELNYALSGIALPTSEQQLQIQHDFALDKSTLRQFFAYSAERLSGNFGISVTSQRPVSGELLGVLPASFELAFVAGLLALIVGVPLGVISALSRSKSLQKLIMAVTLTGYSIPVFWLGLLLSLWFGVQLGWLPISGQINLLYQIPKVTGFMLLDTLLFDGTYKWAAFIDALQHIIMPACTLAVLPFTVVVRITRTAMISVMNQTYIRAAEARGLSNTSIILKHALPNALIPLLKHLGLMLGPFASYAIVVEVIFSWPGIGAWLVSGIYQRDYTVIQGGIFAVALVIIFFSILIEVLYTAANPVSRKDMYGTN
ncbi:peptide ABC transporter permease [Shewanella mangrovi]|uniref:Peptide ABC transporter permease n=1 Tax=Shewanella mangrovi TaxID=1515746 RepID=A0A094JFN9_9GAMM|nr:ABC transporter permease [Shewanella mangrovi]KFZ38062.1 peptide ABC transporter permease [Shewanella mangrovi]